MTPPTPRPLASSTDPVGQGLRVRVAGSLFKPVVPAGAIYVGRGAPGLRASVWANPHKVGSCRVCGVEHDRAAAVLAYAEHLRARADLVAAARRELVGQKLACWCPTTVVCHADVLAATAARADPLPAAAEVLRHVP